MDKGSELTSNASKPGRKLSDEREGEVFCRPQILRISRSDPAISTYLQGLRLLPMRVSVHRSEARGHVSEHLSHQDSDLSRASHHSSDLHHIRGELGKSLSSESSYHTIRCRICYLTGKESEEGFIHTGCHCCGLLQFCHQTCLQKWVDTKGSRECECCLGTFDLDLSEEGRRRLEARQQNAPVYIQMRDGLRVQRVGRVMRPTMILRTDSSCQNNARTWLMTSFIIMVVATACSAALTAYAHEDMVTQDTQAVPMDRTGLSYGLALTFLIFCGVLTLTIGCLWICAELAVLPLHSGLPTAQDVMLSEDSSLQDVMYTEDSEPPGRVSHV